MRDSVISGFRSVKGFKFFCVIMLPTVGLFISTMIMVKSRYMLALCKSFYFTNW